MEERELVPATHEEAMEAVEARTEETQALAHLNKLRAEEGEAPITLNEPD